MSARLVCDGAPPAVLYELLDDGRTALVTLNRPERLNALTFEVYADLRDLLASGLHLCRRLHRPSIT